MSKAKEAYKEKVKLGRTSPAKAPAMGRPQKYPRDAETVLVGHIKILRANKIATHPWIIICLANNLIADTDYAKNFMEEKEVDGKMTEVFAGVSTNWLYRFLHSPHASELGLSKPTSLELARAQWCRSINFHKHFEVLSDVMVQAKVAIYRADFNPDERLGVMLNITKPNRVMSFDETHVTFDSRDTGTKGIVYVKGKDADGNPLDTKEVLTLKCDLFCTQVGGSTAGGLAIPQFTILPYKTLDLRIPIGSPASDFYFQEDQLDMTIPGKPGTDGAPDGPGIHVPGAKKGDPIKAAYASNESGGMTNDMGVQWLQKVRSSPQTQLQGAELQDAEKLPITAVLFVHRGCRNTAVC